MQDTILTDQIGVSVVVVYAMQALKRASWFPWIAEHTDALNRCLAVSVAFLTSVGFQITMVGNWTAGGQLIVVIPAFATIVTVLLHSLSQAGIQESYYKMVVKPKLPAVVLINPDPGKTELLRP